MQIDPNSQAPVRPVETSEAFSAPAPATHSRRGERGKQKKVVPGRESTDVLAPATGELRLADGTATVADPVETEQVIRRLRSGAYNTREVAEEIARRLLGSGDL